MCFSATKTKILLFLSEKEKKIFATQFYKKMKDKYTTEEKKAIAEEGIKAKDKYTVADKYNIHFTTLYTWIRQLENKKGKNYYITLKVSKEEKESIESKCKAMGYENYVSTYIKKILFSKHIASGNPKEIVQELYRARAEINKVGTNINQIANYTNFLKNQNYMEEGFYNELRKEVGEFLRFTKEQRTLIDKTFKKI